MEFIPGRKVRVTFEGYPAEFSVYGGGRFLTVTSRDSRATLNTNSPDVTVETIPLERPSWWDRTTPDTVVETRFSNGKRAVKRNFMGTCAPEDAETHPWLWTDGTPATEDDILAWGPLRLVAPGKGMEVKSGEGVR